MTSKIFLKNFALLIGSFLFLLIGFFWFLNWYTLHEESIEVPNLLDRTPNQASRLLAVKKLRYVVADSSFKDGKLPGVILKQTPKAGARVKESRTIYLTVSSFPPKIKLTYRDIIGSSRDMLERKFNSWGLKIGRTTYISGRGKNTVKSASINGQTLFEEIAFRGNGDDPRAQSKLVEKNTVIDLVLYQGLDAAPKQIPDLVCKTFGESEVVIKSNNFYVGNIHIMGGLVVDTVNAFVAKQSPEAYSAASMGTGVNLWLIQNRPEACDDEDELLEEDLGTELEEIPSNSNNE